jgi:hypothetical protein
MPDRTSFKGMKKTLHRVANDMFDRVDEFTQIGKIRLKIGMMKGEVKDLKYEIGDLVFRNLDKFGDQPEIAAFANKIQDIEADIQQSEVEIGEIKSQRQKKQDEA